MAQVKQYSLLDFSISITFKKKTYNIPLGGFGSYLGNISISKNTDNISTTVDSTGSGVFSFSADNSGTIEIEITQVSDKISQIIQNMQNYYQSTVSGDWKNALVDITIHKNAIPIIEATNCMLVKMPDWTAGPEVSTRTYSFSAIEIREMPVVY